MNIVQKTLLGLVVLAGMGSAHAGAVVAAKDSPFAAIDAEEAKKIFLGREPLIGGQAVTVIYQKDGDTRTTFENKILGKTGADLTAYWSKLIFTGRAQAPTEANSNGEVKLKVNEAPGAIGYVDDSAVDASVKVLLKY
jgi:ABC-type phosphate transport system substrate-binding protein